ncbi:MAG: tetratricopeptide repeat protein [Bacteroidales bacterium]|nr:tetratricopeptide repeat protein [Bacteroidales bacterium]
MRKSILFLLICASLFPKAQSFTDSVSNSYKNLPFKNQVDSINELSRSYRISYPDKAIILNFLADKISTENRYNEGRIKSLQLLGYTYHYHQVNDSAIFYYKKALDIAKKSKNVKERAVCHGSMAINFNQQNLYDKSIEYFELARKDFQELKDINGEAKVYANIGNVYLSKGSSRKALESYLQSVNLCEKIDDNNLMAANLSNIAIIYQNLEEIDKAIEYQFRVLKLIKNREIPIIVDSYNNIGLSYKMLGKTDSAKYYFTIAIETADKLAIKDKYCLALNNMGTLFYEAKDFKKAYELFAKALVISEEIGDLRATAFYQNNIASTYIEIGKFELATEKAYSSLQIALPLDAKNEITESYKLLAEGNYRQGLYKEAFDYLKLFNVYNDSLIKENATKEIARLKNRFELLEKEKELKIKNQEIELYKKNEKISELNRMGLVFVIFFVVVIAFLIIINQRRRLKKNKLLQEKESALMSEKLRNADLERTHLETELEYKNQEITNFALHIVEKNEFLEKLKSIAEQNSETESSQLKTLIAQNLTIEKEREEFRAQVEQINEGFFLKLNEQFPNLTKNEIRLAALLRLNLSSKEISTLLNISPSSVDMNRHRLRKKINLDADLVLSDFFKTI